MDLDDRGGDPWGVDRDGVEPLAAAPGAGPPIPPMSPFRFHPGKEASDGDPEGAVREG